MKLRQVLSSLALVVLACAAGSAVADKVRFSQLPDMVGGTDHLSMHRTFGPVVADDFIVDKPTILGLRWWGSYLRDDPNLAPGQSRAVSFEVSHHADCPAFAPPSAACPGDPRGGPLPLPYGYSTPGQPYQFQIVTADETLFGVTAAGERVYEYFAMLNTPWASYQNAIAWLDIAWAAGQLGTDFAADVWGWHESFQHNFDWAVQTDRLANPVLPLGGNPHLGPWNALMGRDMAFQVITIPEPASVALVGLAMIGALAAQRSRRRERGNASRDQLPA